jgi:hypothetical protein
MLSLDGSTKVSEGSTRMLCFNGDIKVLEGTKVYGAFPDVSCTQLVITDDLAVFSSSATNGFILNIPYR